MPGAQGIVAVSRAARRDVIRQNVEAVVAKVVEGCRRFRCKRDLSRALLLHGPVMTPDGPVRAKRANHLGAGVYEVEFGPHDASGD